MDLSVPASAARILNFIGKTEAPRGYDTVYGNNQAKLAKAVTSMTIDEVIAAGPSWTKRFGSSACGRYQFMRATLQGLKKELGLTGRERLDEGMQDRLAFQLLKRRKWEQFEAGKIGVTEFAKQLAMEWASFPVLKACQGAHRKIARGQSYYAGDGMNKALVRPEQIEALLGVRFPKASTVSPVPIALPDPTLLDEPTAPPPVKPLAKSTEIPAGAVVVTGGLVEAASQVSEVSTTVASAKDGVTNLLGSFAGPLRTILILLVIAGGVYWIYKRVRRYQAEKLQAAIVQQGAV
jgi:muramidase (phage lysozyme)